MLYPTHSLGLLVGVTGERIVKVSCMGQLVGKDFPALKIVLMTGYADERARAHNLDALVHQVVSKPFSLAEICETVDAALNAPAELH